MAGQEFDGVPLGDLALTAIDWDARKEHVEQRAARKGTQEFEPKVEWATEAAADPNRLVGRTTTAVYVIGYSPAADRVLLVMVQPTGHASEGEWIGLTARAANDREQRRYHQD